MTGERDTACRQCGKPTLRGPRAWFCVPCAIARNEVSIREANRRWSRSEGGRAYRRRVRPKKKPETCVRCGERPARTARSLHCLPCRHELHRLYSREYRRSPVGKVKYAEWIDRHPGYQKAHRKPKTASTRIDLCATPLCGRTFLQSRNGLRRYCVECQGAFFGRRYAMRQAWKTRRVA